MVVRWFSGAGFYVGGLLLLGCLALALLLAQTGHAAGAGYGPVASYSFDEGEGTMAQDATGNEHTATIEGAEWVRGRYGDALEFKGSEHDVVKVPASSGLNFEEEFTLEAWVRPAGSTDTLAPIVGKTTGGGSGGESLSYYLYAGDGESRPYGEVQHTPGTGNKATATSILPGGAWSHLALTYDGAKERLYVNGVQVAETATEAPVTTTGELQIGAETEHGEWFSGRIDEVRIYDRVLSGAEVDAGMETPIQTPKQGPVAAYSFDEDPGEGAIVPDDTGHGHTATIHGAKWTEHGRYGGAMQFDGEDDYLSIPASEGLDGDEEVTVEAWVRPTDSRFLGEIAMKEREGSGAAYSWTLDQHRSAPAAYLMQTEEGMVEGGEESLPLYTWTHVALTDDGAHDRLYVNGELVDTAPAIPFDGHGEIRIGGNGIFEQWFEGRIDEVRIYGRALNSAEVAYDMEAPIQTPKHGPVAAWSFDEGEGETVEDVTGDGHTATIEEGERTPRGRYGGAIAFEGNSGDKCISVPDSPELRLSEEFTIESWVRPEGGVYEDPVVVRESGGDLAFGLGLGSRESEKAEGFIGEGAEAAVADEEIDEHTWTQVTTTWDGARIRLYMDGELVATEDATTPPAVGEGALKIGCDGPDGQFGGRIDEVRVYNRALDAGEVAADMETPLQTPKATPVASYSFDEENEETQADTTGDGHTATVEGARWSEHGRYGGAMEFDAAEEGVLRIPASPELSFDEEFTLEAWVRPSGADNHHAPLIDKQEGGHLGYFLYEGGKVSDRPYGAPGEEEEYVHADDPLPAHAWSHVALTFDGNRTWLYVDGKPVDNGAAEPLITSEGELEIGGSTDTSEYFDGRIDEVRIYNRALNGAEVAADMEAPIQTPKQSPIAAWSFEEGEGSTVEDVTGDEHEGTIEGAEWVRGKYGDGLKFDGEDDVVKVPSSPEFDLTEGFTLESWVRPESESNEWAPILAKEIGGGKAAEELSWWLYEGGSEPNVPSGGTEPMPGERNEAHSEDPLPVEAWSHVALTYDGAQVRLYINGELVDCSPVPAGAPPVTEGELQIGAATEHGDYFKGRIDEVRIYNRALNAGEVADDLGPLGMTAAYISEEEGEEVQAEATTFYPQTGTGASATYGAPTVMTSVTRFGAPIQSEGESGASPFTPSGAREKPYQFAKCEYSHNEPGVMDPGTRSGPSRGVLKEIAQEAAASVQKAAKTTKPHGFPNCDGNYDAKYFHFQWGDEIWGDFFYEANKKVWIEEAPQCESWAPEAVELEWAEYRQKVREGRNPHLPLRQDARPKEERCFAPRGRESTTVPGGIDVVSYMSWTPAYLFKGGGGQMEREKVCGDLDGHLTANPPSLEENGLIQIWRSRHLYAFYEGRNLPCNWADPGGKVKHY